MKDKPASIRGRARWFSGIRLSTFEQDDYVKRALADPDMRGIGTGDTIVRVEAGHITVYRQDYSIELSANEYKARKHWIDGGPEA